MNGAEIGILQRRDDHQECIIACKNEKSRDMAEFYKITNSIKRDGE